MRHDLTKAVELIKQFEGIIDGYNITPNYDPYLCPALVWTIGYGHAITDVSGKQIKGSHNEGKARSVYPNGITLEEAEKLLLDDVRKFSNGVEKLVKVTLSDEQFCALVSFAFNVGLTAFKNSTLLILVNQHDFLHAGEQFLRWTKSNGKELAGLKRRREAEETLWFYGSN